MNTVVVRNRRSEPLHFGSKAKTVTQFCQKAFLAVPEEVITFKIRGYDLSLCKRKVFCKENYVISLALEQRLATLWTERCDIAINGPCKSEHFRIVVVDKTLILQRLSSTADTQSQTILI